MLNRLDTSILFHSDRFISLHLCNGRCATNKYFQIIGSIHDIESYFGIDNTSFQLGKVHATSFSSLTVYFSDTLQWCYIVGFTLNLELEIIHLHKKLALDIKVAYFDLATVLLHYNWLSLNSMVWAFSTCSYTNFKRN